jgi:hypothetical protein
MKMGATQFIDTAKEDFQKVVSGPLDLVIVSFRSVFWIEVQVTEL